MDNTRRKIKTSKRKRLEDLLDTINKLSHFIEDPELQEYLLKQTPTKSRCFFLSVNAMTRAITKAHKKITDEKLLEEYRKFIESKNR
jgi:hypothetical protein